jgi:VWFA-related protein
MRAPLALIVVAPLLGAMHATTQAPPEPPPAQVPTLTFGTQVELVTVDAVVVDRRGRPVRGLKQSDFVVREEGTRQQIVSFEEVRVPPPTEGPTPRHPVISFNTGASARPTRLFVVVFDDMHLNAVQAYRAKRTVEEFLRTGVREGDRVVLIATSGGAWWSARMEAGRDDLIGILKRFEGRRIVDHASQERLTDYEAMRILSHHDPAVAARVGRRFESAGLTQQMRSGAEAAAFGMINPFIEMRARQVYEEARVRNRLTLSALKRATEALTLAKGRKSLILVSEGFMNDPSLQGLRDVVRAAREANVAIYFVDTRGLEGAFSAISGEFGAPSTVEDLLPLYADPSRDADGSVKLAEDTGGFTVGGGNDLAKGIARISQESESYYLLGYNPLETFQDGRFRKIDVRVNRKGVTVRARRGYYSPVPGQPAAAEPKAEDTDPALQQAVDAPFDLDDIPIRMTAYAFGETLIDRAKVLVAAEVDLRGLAFRDQEGRLADRLDMLLVVSHRETGELHQYPQQVAMRLRPKTLEDNPWYPFVHEFDLGPGSYQARIVVRDANDDSLGSLMHSFSLPDLGAFRASTPLITDKVAPSEEDPEIPRPVVIARRTFRNSGMLYCQVEVYNAARDPATGEPRVTYGFSLVDGQQRTVHSGEPTLITPTPQGGLSRLLGFKLDSFAPGDYELVVNLKDEVSGKTLTLRGPLTLEAAEPGA